MTKNNNNKNNHNNNDENEKKKKWQPYENIKTLKQSIKCSSKTNTYLLKREKRSESHLLLEHENHLLQVLISLWEKNKKGRLYSTCHELLSEKWIVKRY